MLRLVLNLSRIFEARWLPFFVLFCLLLFVSGLQVLPLFECIFAFVTLCYRRPKHLILFFPLYSYFKLAISWYFKKGMVTMVCSDFIVGIRSCFFRIDSFCPLTLVFKTSLISSCQWAMIMPLVDSHIHMKKVQAKIFWTFFHSGNTKSSLLRKP